MIHVIDFDGLGICYQDQHSKLFLPICIYSRRSGFENLHLNLG